MALISEELQATLKPSVWWEAYFAEQIKPKLDGIVSKYRDRVVDLSDLREARVKASQTLTDMLQQQINPVQITARTYGGPDNTLFLCELLIDEIIFDSAMEIYAELCRKHNQKPGGKVW